MRMPSGISNLTKLGLRFLERCVSRTRYALKKNECGEQHVEASSYNTTTSITLVEDQVFIYTIRAMLVPSKFSPAKSVIFLSP
jgi:hypothetical protein